MGIAKPNTGSFSYGTLSSSPLSAGIIANRFEGGRSIYLTHLIAPQGSQFDGFTNPTLEGIIVSSVR